MTHFTMLIAPINCMIIKMDWLMLNPLSKCLKGFLMNNHVVKIGAKKAEIPFIEKLIHLNEKTNFKCFQKLEKEAIQYF